MSTPLSPAAGSVLVGGTDGGTDSEGLGREGLCVGDGDTGTSTVDVGAEPEGVSMGLLSLEVGVGE